MLYGIELLSPKFLQSRETAPTSVCDAATLSVDERVPGSYKQPLRRLRQQTRAAMAGASAGELISISETHLSCCQSRLLTALRAASRAAGGVISRDLEMQAAKGPPPGA